MSTTSFDNLSSFFRLCQFCGFLPFRMETDKETGRFRKLSLSLCYPITWWSVVNGIVSILVFTLLMEELFTNFDIVSLPLIIKITTLTVIIMHLVLSISCRFWLVVRFPTVSKAIQLMQQLETHQQDNQPAGCKSTLRRRTILGVFSTCLGAVFLAIAAVQVLKKPLSLKYGFGVMILVSSLATLFVFTSCCALLFVHLVYYQLSHLIKVMRVQLENTASELGCENELNSRHNCPAGAVTKLESHMKANRRLFDFVCCATSDWNKVFSLPLLFAISTKIVTVAFSLFGFIQGFFMEEVLLSGVQFLQLAYAVIDCFILMILFWAADGPVQEATDFRESVTRLHNSHLMNSTNEVFQGMIFKAQISGDRLRLSTGLFSVGVHLIPTIVASIVTYLVILLQTQG